jgi:hypothetical protein
MVTPMESFPKTDSDTADGCPGTDVDVDVAASAAAAERDTASSASSSRGLRLGRIIIIMVIMMMDPFHYQSSSRIFSILSILSVRQLQPLLLEGRGG